MIESLAKTEALYQRTAVWLLPSLAAATLLAYTLNGNVANDPLILWFTATAIIATLQLSLTWFFNRSITREEYDRRWMLAAASGWILSGLCWGAASLLFLPEQSTAQQALIVVIVISLSMGLIWPLSVFPSLALAYLTANAGSLTYTLYFYPGSDPETKTANVVMILFLAMLFTAYRLSKSTEKSLQNKLQNLVTIQEAEALNINLKEQITERLNIEQELNKAKDIAETAARSKADFLATMSHEIRTPLNGVLGMLDLLKEMDMNAEQQELTETAHYSAESLLSIINNVLDFSKIEIGELELENIEFNLQRTLKDVSALMQRRAEEKNIYVNMARRSTGTPTTVMGDPTRLRQILTNLVGNAVKFTATGGVDVSLTLMRKSTAGVLLRFEVRDTGIGISKPALTKLFQPFSQADSSMARNYGGSGLGLSIAKNLVTLMGGEIGVESRPGNGSLFWFTVPFYLPGQTQQPIRRSISDTRILLVGEENTEMQATKSLLQQWKTNLDTAASTSEALVKMTNMVSIGTSWLYEAIIICADINTRNQHDLIQTLSHNKDLSGISIIAYTHPATEQTNRRTSNMVTWLDLPVNNHQLFRAIAENTSGPDGHAKHQIIEDAVDVLVDEPPTFENLIEKKNTKPTNISFQNQKILVVEDNMVNQKVINTLLNKMNLKVDTANDGFQGVEAVQQGAFDAVLMDCQMPGMDGFEATRAIRAWEQEKNKPRTPIIAVTANAMEGDRERCLDSGMDDYLAKPINRQLLAELLQNWLHVSSHKVENIQVAEQERDQNDDTINTQVLEELKDIMEDSFPELIRTYLNDAQQRLKEIHAAVKEKDSKALRASAHTLKSSSANVAALRLSSIAADLELLARNGNTSGGSSLFNEALDEYKQVKKILLSELS